MLCSVALVAALIVQAHAQLSGSVGPLLSATHKADVKVCDITDYGATTDADVAPYIQDAWNACATVGGLVYIPPDDWPMQTTVTLKDATSIAIQWDGTIYRDSDTMEDQMFTFSNNVDLEIFSGNSKGAIQGYGYEYLENGDYGVRLMRFVSTSNFSLHGLSFVDSPSYYIVFDTVSSGEVYNLIIRGSTTLGETDGIDVWGSNMWFHDIEVTNGDECVTIKSPSSNMLVQSIYCNLSGGTAIGSLGLDTVVENIWYQHLYMNQADACFIKSNGGSGYVTSVSWRDVLVHGSSYPLTIDLAWEDSDGGVGVAVSNLGWTNFFGYNTDAARAVIRMECTASAPCYELTLSNVHMWTDDGDVATYFCQDAYGSGACLVDETESEDPTDYTTSIKTTTSSTLGTGSTMAADFTAALSPTGVMTIPPVPTSFYPGETPISTLLSYKGPVTYEAVQS